MMKLFSTTGLTLVAQILVLTACPQGLQDPQQFYTDLGSGDSGPGETDPCTLSPTALLKPCNGCHSTASSLGGLDLESDGLVARLSGKKGKGCEQGLLIDPDKVENSLLYALLRSAGPDKCSGIMPPGSPGGFDDADAACILKWLGEQTASAQ